MRRLALVVVFLLSAGEVSADWLVTRDGARIETKGAWEVRGSQVVFTLPSGTLSALRLAEVDLDSSKAASEEAKRPRKSSAEGLAERRQPVLKLTNRDVARASVTEASGGMEDGGGTEGTRRGQESDKSNAAADSGPVQVVFWESRELEPDKDGYDGVEITGTVQNNSDDLVTDVAVKVMLVDAAGEIIAARDAFLNPSLGARHSTTFRALFRDAPTFDIRPRFKVSSRPTFFSGSEESPEESEEAQESIESSS